MVFPYKILTLGVLIAYIVHSEAIMTGWDIASDIIQKFPPLSAAILLIAAAVIFIVGFSRRGVNFIKYGFGQTTLDSSLEKRFDDLAERMATKEDIARLDAKIEADIAKLDAKIGADISRLDAKIEANIGRLDAKIEANIGRLDTKIEAIETNHFGHLKNFLTELTSILLDKDIINNTEKARLDNELRGM